MYSASIFLFKCKVESAILKNFASNKNLIWPADTSKLSKKLPF